MQLRFCRNFGTRWLLGPPADKLPEEFTCRRCDIERNTCLWHFDAYVCNQCAFDWLHDKQGYAKDYKIAVRKGEFIGKSNRVK